MSVVWMSAPTLSAVERNEYTNGPAPWRCFTPDSGDIIVAKTLRGTTLFVEDWSGNRLTIPNTHEIAHEFGSCVVDAEHLHD